MGKPLSQTDSTTRRHLLEAALKGFAERGYAATSVQDIVDAARVSKPALYYYFGDKAGLFQSLVDQAHDERYRLMTEAAARGATVAEKLEEIVAAVFEFSVRNRALTRLAFATAFAESGEPRERLNCTEKGRRNFEFVRSLIEQGQRSGELSRELPAEQLALGLYGQITTYVMIRLFVPESPLDRETARNIVRLFMEGARARAGRPLSPSRRLRAGSAKN